MESSSPFPRPAVVLWAAIALSVTPAAGQLRWQLPQPDPVLVAGSSQWDAVAVGQPSCVVEDDRIVMWYTGAAADQRGRIMTAWSTDGVTWSRHPDPVLNAGGSGAWDAWIVDTPSAVPVDGGYYLYYYGQSTSATSDGSAIGVAKSDDGLVFERLRDTPVIGPGPVGAWDERWVESPDVHFDRRSGLWRMWYTGMGADWVAQIGLATSPDGVHWAKYPGNPVLEIGTAGTWEDYWVAVPTVHPWRFGYWMFYCGVSAADLADGPADRPLSTTCKCPRRRLTVKSFDEIWQRALDRKGSAEAIESRMPNVKSAEELAAIPDHRWLAEMTRSVFRAGFSWKVIWERTPSC